MTSPFRQRSQMGVPKSPFAKRVEQQANAGRVDPIQKEIEAKGGWDLDSDSFERINETGMRSAIGSLAKGVGKGIADISQAASTADTASLPAMLGTRDPIKQTITPEDIDKWIPDELAPNFATRTIEKSGRYGTMGALFGASGILPSMVSGAVGQSLEEAGAPKWLQVTGEILSGILTPAKGLGTRATPTIKEVADNPETYKKLLEAGLDETTAKQVLTSMGDPQILTKIGKLTTKAEKDISTGLENVEGVTKNIIEEAIPGIDNGIQGVKDTVDIAYQPVNRAGQTVKIENTKPIKSAIDEVITSIKKTLKTTGEEDKLIEFLEGAKEKFTKPPKTEKNAVKLLDAQGKPLTPASKEPIPLTADEYVNFYQSLNREGSWLAPGKKEHYFGVIKQAIKDTFKGNGPAGERLANAFEKANEANVKYTKAKKFNDVFQQNIVDGSINFQKVSKQMSDPKKYKIYEEALGKEATEQVHLLAKGASKMKELEKELSKGLGNQLFQGIKVYKFGSALLSMDATAMAGVIGSEAAQRLSARMLTDPKFRERLLLMQQKAKDGAWKSLGTDIENVISDS